MASLSPQQTGKGRTGGPLYGTFTPVTAFLVYVDPRAVQLVSGSSDADPFGVDPRAVQLVSSSSDADVFGVDPRAVQLVS
jgi:hypothetical protein